MLVDSHCHLDRIDLNPYKQDFARMMAQTQKDGVAHILCVSINLERYPIMRNLIANYPQVSISVGVHPNESPNESLTSSAVEKLQEKLASLAQDRQNVAIGETGLDYYRTHNNSTWQQQRFRAHIRAARNCNKPLIIHSRQAAKDTLRILHEEQAADVGGVFHCFTETWDVARAVLDLGFYLSFSGIITFPKSESLREVARLVPLDRLLVETDSPYLAPVPYRGKSNEPRYVAIVAEQMAEIRGMTRDNLVAATGANFLRLFNPKIATEAS